MADEGSPDAQLDSVVRSTRAGVHVMTAPDAAGAAVELAQRTGGEVLSDANSAEAAFEARMLALDQPTITAAEIEGLRRLASELRRAGRIRTRTRSEVTETIARRVSGSTGVELHSSSLLEAAGAVIDLEAELEPLQDELASLDAPIVSARDKEEPLPEMFDDAAVERARNRIVASGTMIAFAGVALVLYGLSSVVLLPLLVVAVGLAYAVVILRRNRIETTVREAEVAETSERLAMLDVIDTTAEERLRLVRRTALDASIAGTTERLRSARRHWEAVAGAGADPRDIDAVLRTRDPQYDLSRAAQTSPTIRTVDSLYRRALARWRVAWAAVGVDEPPDPDDLDTHLHSITHDTGPLVLVDPVRWLSAERLGEVLQQLPAGVEVYIVKQA